MDNEDDDEQRALLANLEQAAAGASSTTTDKRMAALQALEVQLGRPASANVGALLALSDGITTALRGLAKQPNPLVSGKALADIPTWIEALTASHDQQRAHRVRHALDALVPLLVDKLSDHREKARDSSRAALVALASAATTLSPAPPSSTSTHAKSHHTETHIALFERLIIESGLHSKVAKTKEQCIHLLPVLRDSISRFPLRPFLPSLIDHLSDADPGVREASRSTCIALFSTATAPAKAELKREMEKKAVRKQTADAVLAQVFLAGNSNSAAAEQEVSSAPSYSKAPPTTMPAEEQGPARSASRLAANTASDIRAVHVASQWELDRTFAAMLPHFGGKETEHNWQAREQSIVKLRGMLKTSTHETYPTAFQTGVKSVTEGILKAIASLRTTLSMHGITLVSELAYSMGDDLEGVAETLLTALVSMAGFTKKIIANSSQTAVKDILKNVSYRHKYLELVWQGLADKGFSTRVAMCQHLVTIFYAHGRHRKHALEGHGGLELITKFMKKSLMDPNKDVRMWAREGFYRVEEIWPAHARSIFESLDAAFQKQVDANRNTRGSGMAVPPTPMKSAEAAMTPARAPARTGPSSAILAAKRAAAASLAQERRRQEAAEVKAREEAEAEAEAAAAAAAVVADAGETRMTAVACDDLEEVADHADLRQPDASQQVGEDEDESLMDLQEGEEAEDQQYQQQQQRELPARTTPARIVAKSSTTSYTPASGRKSPVSQGSASPPLSVRSSHIPVPSSPTGSRSSVKPAGSGISSARARTRTTSASSIGSSRSSTVGRGGSAGTAAAERFGSITQRFEQHTPSHASRSATAGRALSPADVRLQKEALPSSHDELDQSVNEVAEEMARALLISSPAPSAKSQGGTGHISPSVLGSPSSPSLRSRLPRPVSMSHSASPPQLAAAKGTRHVSDHPTDTDTLFGTPTKARGVSLTARRSAMDNTSHKPIDRAPAAAPAPATETASRAPPTTPGAPSASKWFLGKAQRLDHAHFPQQQDDLATLSPVKRRPESEDYIVQLVDGRASLRTFKGLVSLSKEFKLPERPVYSGEDEKCLENGHGDVKGEYDVAVAMWQEGRLFERLSGALHDFLLADKGTAPAVQSRDLQTAALVLLHRLVENQLGLYTELGREQDLVNLLLDLVGLYSVGSSASSVKSACQTIADRWADQTDALIGIATLRSVLVPYLSDASSSGGGGGAGDASMQDVSIASTGNEGSSSPSAIAVFTLSLRSLARLFGRLPAEVVEEQMERCRSIVKRGLSHRHIETRQQAVGVLVAANRSLGDPQSLFGILQPIDKAQQDLLVYYMNKGS